jgi:hypothetical protein
MEMAWNDVYIIGDTISVADNGHVGYANVGGIND